MLILPLTTTGMWPSSCDDEHDINDYVTQFLFQSHRHHDLLLPSQVKGDSQVHPAHLPHHLQPCHQWTPLRWCLESCQLSQEALQHCQPLKVQS